MSTKRRKRRGRGSGGVTGLGFRPGESGNPGGRPKSPADYIRSQTDDGQELVDHAITVLRKPRAPWKAQAEAREFLAAYCWGRPAQSHKVALEGQQDIYVFPPGTDPTTPDDQLPSPLVLAMRARLTEGDEPRRNGDGEIAVEPPR